MSAGGSHGLPDSAAWTGEHLRTRAAELIGSPLGQAMFGRDSPDDRVGDNDRANCRQFARFRLHPRVLVDVAHRRASTTLLGRHVPLPVVLGPIGAMHRLHPDGEEGVVAVANRSGVPCVISAVSGRSFRSLAAPAPDSLWSQLYMVDRSSVKRLVHYYEDAGSAALVVTVDNPGIASAERASMGSGLGGADWGTWNDLGITPAAGRSELMVEAVDPATTWNDLQRIREMTSLPLIIKGIQHRDDARLAREVGANALVVSNHGGHAAPRAAPLLSELPEIVEAAAGIDVLYDGGIRSGRDVFTALALGATSVLIGRLLCWSLFAGGPTGVAAMLGSLRDELLTTMAFAGTATVPEIARHHLSLS